MKWYEDPIYIKMSEKAEEIQKEWKPVVGDIAICPGAMLPYFKTPSILTYLENEGEEYRLWFNVPDDNYVPKVAMVWLPRQDELQEMVKKWLNLYITKEKLQYSYLWNLWLCFSEFVMNEKYQGDKNVTDIFTSMEQLWLAFVMKKIYNKVWDGKNWIKN